MSFGIGNLFAADNIGRLFTSPDERRALDQLRYHSKIDLTLSLPDTDAGLSEDDTFQPEGIRLNGLVYRKNGKSTAWINDSNTFEGNLATDYLEVRPYDIKPNSVRIKLHDNPNPIRIKTGQTYDPVENRVVDIVEKR